MKIEFIPEISEKELIHPESAIQNLPDWYKKKLVFLDSKKSIDFDAPFRKNITVKWCNPFGDALGAGYFILLENEIFISKTEGQVKIIWHRGGDDFVSTHDKEQIDLEIIPPGFSSQPYKFRNFWAIRTPKGYSVMITHPHNRPNMPFFTLSGIVDTDKYNQPINFPFLLRDDFEGFIPAKTPIAQIIPFKREDWAMDIAKFDSKRNSELNAQFNRHLNRPYKRFFWTRKNWK